MNTKKPFFLIFFIVVSTKICSQSLLNASSPEEFRRTLQETKEEDEPTPYPEIEEKDIAWSKAVWEIVDLNEKVNQIYYYDNDELINPRKSLYRALIEGIKKGDIKEIYENEAFKNRINEADLLKKTQRLDTTDAGREILNQGGVLTDEYTDRYDIKSSDIKMFKIKGIWYMDRRMGELRYRLLGLAPMAPDLYQLTKGQEENMEYIELFWVWYSDVRKTLHRAKLHINGDGATRVSFDDLLNARKFSSVIYKESNLYGNRSIEDYLPQDAHEQIQESQRIKENIRKKEEEMWNP